VAAADPAALLPEESATLLPPVPHAGKIVCIGYNNVVHGAAGAVDLPEFPDVFAKTANTVIGPGAAIVLPRVSQQVDYEAELAVVIGRPGREITEAAAMGLIAHLSQVMTLDPGDIIATGTPARPPNRPRPRRSSGFSGTVTS